MSLKMWVTTYQTTRRYIPEYRHPNSHRCPLHWNSPSFTLNCAKCNRFRIHLTTILFGITYVNAVLKLLNTQDFVT
jgi:hypothetical protein